MRSTLGTFEGRMIQAAALKVNGGVGEKVGTLDQDEEVYLIVKGHVSEITHGYMKSTYTRMHKVSATRIVILDPADGSRMLEEALMLQDDRFGLAQLFNDGERAIGHDPETGEIADPEAVQPQLGLALVDPEDEPDWEFDGTEGADEEGDDA